MSLVLLLVVVSLIILLSTHGIPKTFINKIEEAAKQEGIALKIEKARLSYGSGLGLVIQGCTLNLVGDPEQQASIAFTQAELDLRVSPLLQGEVKPYLIKVNGGSLRLSDKGKERLEIEGINISASVTNNDIVKIACLSPIDFQGILLYLKADIPIEKIYPHAEGQSARPKTPSDQTVGEQLKDILQEYRDSLNSLHELSLQQEWMLSKESPQIKLSLNALNRPHCHFELYFPSCSYENVTLEELELNAVYANDAIIIHKLTAQTELTHDKQQKAQINLQGGYDLKDNHLTFTLDCKLPLFNIIHDLLESVDIDLLQNIPTSSENDSDMRLEGEVYLKENLRLKQANLIGYIMQKELQLGGCHINELELSFFLNEENFAIDKARIKMGESELSAQSQLKDGKGTITLKSDLTAQQIISLKDGLQAADEASQLPEQLQLAYPLVLEASAQIDTPESDKGSQPFINYIPHVEQLDISLSTQEIGYGEHHIQNPQIKLLLENLRESEEQILQKLQAQISADHLKSVIDGKPVQARSLTWEGQMEDIRQKPEQVWQAAQAQGELSLKELEYDGTRIARAQISLTEASQINYPASDGKYWQKLLASAQISDIEYRECNFQSLNLQLNANSLEHFSAQVALLLDPQSSEHIKLDVERKTKENISLRNISIQLPTDIINKLLPKDSWEAYNITLLDSKISVTGEANLVNKEGLQLQSLQLDLNIPQIERGTSGIPALADKRNTLGLEAALELNYNDARQLHFRLPHFNITSNTGHISGSASSPEEGKVSIELTSSMRPDTIDELLGDISAHRIIRDFEFNPKSKVLLKQAQVEIDYRDGLDILVHSDVEIEDIKLVLGHYQTIFDQDDHPTVEEKLNPDKIAKLHSHITKGNAKLIVDVQIAKKKEGEELAPLEKSLISINDITLQFDNKPWLAYKKIKGGVSSSTLKSKSVVLDTKDNSVRIYEAKGKVYPDYAIGTFYYDLRRQLQMLELTQPADIDSSFCQFPIAKKSKIPMAGNIKISSKKLINLVVQDHKIPLNQFSGYISFGKKLVYLDRLNAYTWNGVLDAKLRLDIIKNDVKYDGELTARGLNLKEIGKSFGLEQEKALCSGNIRFQSASSDLDDLKAYGNIELLNGDLLKLRIFTPLSDLVNNISQLVDIQKHIIDSEKESENLNFFQRISSGASRATAKGIEYAHGGMKWVGGLFGSTANNIPSANHIFQYDLQNATCQFEIRDGHFIARQMKAYGSNLSLLMDISIRLKDKYVNANIWPNISSLLGITLSPITSISNYILDINVFGPVDDMDWKIKLQAGSTDSIKEIMNKATFRKKAKADKN